MTEWQSIETAPKDGTEFVMLDANVRTATVGYWMERRPRSELAGAGMTRAAWFPLATPTHWMPLPDPPAMKPDLPARLRAASDRCKLWPEQRRNDDGTFTLKPDAYMALLDLRALVPELELALHELQNVR